MKQLLFSVCVLMLVSSVAFSQAEIGFNGIGGRVGYVMPEDPIDDTFGFGLDADLGTLMPNLKLFGFVDYWSKSYDYGYGGDASISLIGIGAAAKYMFAMEGNIKPYAGGGLALSIVKGSFEYTDYLGHEYDESSSDTEFGIHLLGGAMMPLSQQLDGFAEAKYVISDAEYFGIYVGVIYKLAK